MAEKKRFYVVGGEYADTTFTTMARPDGEERHGPFGEHEAHDFWRGITGKTVDNALVRYVINADDVGGETYWVVGGEYADTSFSRIAAGHGFETHGPFGDRKRALEVWRSLTGKTVDNAMIRYDIASAEEVEEIRKLA